MHPHHIRLSAVRLGLSLLLAFAATWSAATAEVQFTHGVASGDVTSQSAVLWTRVDGEANLAVELSTDSGFPAAHTTVTRTQASALRDLTVKIVVEDLQPGTRYHYRWISGDTYSETGTFVTPPGPGETASLRFAYSGDTDGTFWDGVPFHNEFEVLDAIRREEPDFFVYLGDTVYADPVSRTFFVGLPPVTDPEEYRELYRINRHEYPALPRLLKTTSTYATWDDHEVQNDFAGLTVDPFLFEGGRRAFMEYMPIDEAALPLDEDCPARPMYRSYRWGKHAEIFVLDERTCRSGSAAAACGADIAPMLDRDQRKKLADISGLDVTDEPPRGCLATLFDPSRTMLGKVQKSLFKEALLNSTATFKFVVNQVPIQQLYALPYDRWEGYPAERKEILRFIQRNRIKNVIFLTTDFHVNLINGVYVDRFLNRRPAALEFVAGPVAELTLEEEIRYFSALLVGLDPDKTMKVVEFIVQLIGIDCWDLGGARPLLGGSGEPRFTYGLVEVDGDAGEATISIRDRHGNVIPDRDPRDPGELCARTISAEGRTRTLPTAGPGGRRPRR